MKKVISVVMAIFFLAITTNSYATTLDRIKKTGVLNCGVSGNLPGFSAKDNKGIMQGFDADYCRAVATAVGVNKVNFVNLSSKERLPALKNKEIDLLSRTTTWTISRDRSGFEFIGSIFYDGEGFMVPSSTKFESAKDLEGASFCVREGTTTDRNLANYFGSQNIKYQTKKYKNKKAVDQAYLNRDCQVYVLDASALASIRTGFENPEKHTILDIRISKEPLSPVVREGDDQWADIARWTLFLLVALEEHHINQQILIDKDHKGKFSASQLTFMHRLEDVSAGLGLDKQWGSRVAKTIGNYDDMFSRNLGRFSPMKMERGLNELWTNGGLMYSPPFN